ncbi:MAG: zf-HC2 domain-containing protein [Actinomycetota bacterium]
MINRLLKRFRRTPSCDEIMEVLQAYLDGEVDVETARKVAGHLEDCAACSHESDVYDRIKTTLSSRRRDIDPNVRAALEAFSQDLRSATD